MADTKKNPSSADAKPGSDAGSTNKCSGVLSAYEECQKALQAAAARAQQQCNDAQAEYLRSIGDAHQDARRGQEDAYRAYANSMQQACGRDDAARLAREAQQVLLDALEKLRAAVRQRTQEAERKAADAVQAANDEANKVWREAWIACVKSGQEQIARLDPMSIHSEGLAAVAQSLLAASCSIGATTRHS